VVLNFWVTWCEPCRTEISELVELQKRYLDAARGHRHRRRGCLSAVQAASKQLNINYPVALGDKKQVRFLAELAFQRLRNRSGMAEFTASTGGNKSSGS